MTIRPKPRRFEHFARRQQPQTSPLIAARSENKKRLWNLTGDVLALRRNIREACPLHSLPKVAIKTAPAASVRSRTPGTAPPAVSSGRARKPGTDRQRPGAHDVLPAGSVLDETSTRPRSRAPQSRLPRSSQGSPERPPLHAATSARRHSGSRRPTRDMRSPRAGTASLQAGTQRAPHCPISPKLKARADSRGEPDSTDRTRYRPGKSCWSIRRSHATPPPAKLSTAFASAISRSCRRRYSITVVTTTAWLHVSGLTLIISPVYG